MKIGSSHSKRKDALWNKYILCGSNNVHAHGISGSGHYLLMHNRDSSYGREAALLSPFIHTTGKCLEIYFQMLGDIDTSFTVHLVREDQLTLVLYEVSEL